MAPNPLTEPVEVLGVQMQAHRGEMPRTLTGLLDHDTIRGSMSQVFGYVLLALCLFVGYQGYENARAEAAREMAAGRAKLTACEVDPSCVLTQEHPRVIKADVFRRRYEFQTTLGAVTVTCDRRFIWLGPWACAAEKGTL